MILLLLTNPQPTPKLGVWAEIPTAQLGTGLKVIVAYNGVFKERTASEGVPMVLDPVTRVPRQLLAGETLQQ